MNSVILVGRLTKDPEMRYTQGSSLAIAHFTLAVDRPVKQGEEKTADFIRITVFGRQAETVDRYLFKGSQAAIEGKIQTGSYKDKDGKTVYTTTVIANRVEFIGSKQDASTGADYEPRQATPEPELGDFFQGCDDDIPF
jgi:single-strand DNA-binding protein